jgi:hypothetical protein
VARPSLSPLAVLKGADDDLAAGMKICESHVDSFDAFHGYDAKIANVTNLGDVTAYSIR